MLRGIFILLQVLLLASLTLGTSGCSEDETDAGSIINPSLPETDPEVEPDPDPVVDTTPVGEVEATGFWVNVQSDQYDVFIDNTSGFGTDCFIDKDDPNFTDMVCNVDVLEGSLYVQDIEMQYNAPPDLCELVTIRPSWMWNESIGTGPTRVALLESELVVDEPVLGDCRAFNENETDGGSPGFLGSTNMITCASHPEVSSPTGIEAPTCIYDKSESGGRNCCFGEYRLERWEDSDNDGTADTLIDSSDGNSWGGDGNIGACLSPFISDGWQEFTPDGIPSSVIRAVPRDPESLNPVGLNDSVILGSNGGNSQIWGFSTWSNFYTQAGNPHAHDGYYDATVSNLPYAYEPIDDLSGTPIASGRVPWVFECRDNAYELKQRISVYIREWNTLTDFFLYQTSSGVTYNPDVVGDEGTNCEYDGVFGNQNCNDLWDIDDILTNVGGTYDTSTPPNSTLRESYFPNLEID